MGSQFQGEQKTREEEQHHRNGHPAIVQVKDFWIRHSDHIRPPVSNLRAAMDEDYGGSVNGGTASASGGGEGRGGEV